MKGRLAVVFLLFLVHAALFYAWIPDDAFISLRVARNLAHGEGAVFNPGDRVEGHTSPLWVILLAPVARAGVPLETAARLVGLLAALLVLAETVRMGRESLGLEAGLELLPGLLLAVSFPFAFYASSGMETPLYALFLLEAARSALHGRPVRTWVSFGLAGLTRPEGWLFGFFTLAFFWVRRRGGLRPRPVLLGFVLPLLLSTAARALYYGDLLPNAFYAKVGGSLLAAVRWTVPVGQLLHFALATGAILILPALVLLVARRRDDRVLYLLGLVLCQVGITLAVGGDILAYHRFMVGVLPFLFLLAVLAGREWARARAAAWTGRVLGILLLLVVGVNVAYTARNVSFGVPNDIFDYWMHSGKHRELGRHIRERYPEARSLVINEVGAVGFYADKVTYDMNGLVDREVGRIWYRGRREGPAPEAPVILEQVAAVLLERRPDLVILPRFGGEPNLGLVRGDAFRENLEGMHPLWRAFFTHPGFREEYERVETIPLIPGLEKVVYARRAEGGP